MTNSLSVALLLLAALAGSCHDHAAGASEPGPDVDPIRDSLFKLGVPLRTEDDPRRDPDGNLVANSWLPLGKRFKVNKPYEFLVAGFELRDPAITDPQPASFIERLPATEGRPARTELLHVPRDLGFVGAAHRQAIGGDVDNDGFDETVIAYTDGVLRIKVLDDQENLFLRVSQFNLTAVPDHLVAALHLASGDYDGDGEDEIAVAVSYTNAARGAGEGRVFFFDHEDGELTHLQELDKSFVADQVDRDLLLFVAAGDVDADDAEELVVAVNQQFDDGSGSATGLARAVIFDDWATGFADLASTVVEVSGESAVLANVAVADLDDDEVGEVVLAGLRVFEHSADVSNAYLILVLEDAGGAFAPLATKTHEFSYTNQTDDPKGFWHVYVEPLDFDGDSRQEILVNQIVFENFADVDPEEPAYPWRDIFQIPELLPDDTGYPFTRRTSALAVADVNDDGKDNVLYLTPRGDGFDNPPGREGIRIYGGPTTDHIEIEDLDPLDVADLDLMIAPVDVDNDSYTLEATPDSHRLVYLEPIVVAVLAAAPGQIGVGQNTDACTTAYGRANSTGLSEELSVTVSVRGEVGAKTPPAAQVELEATVGLQTSMSARFGTSQSLQKSVVYTTGPLEDAVIFTTVPYDRYEYTIRRHFEPTLVGAIRYVLLPREPLTLMVEREFFNAVTASGPDDIKIDASVLQHTIGQIDTYPTRAHKDAIKANREAHPFFENGVQHVGQGGGSTELGLDIGREHTDTGSLAIMTDVNVKVSAGATYGLTLGIETEASLSLSYGESMSYIGTVGNIDAEHFIEHRYAFGLFTYYHTHEPSGQRFSVINYWIE